MAREIRIGLGEAVGRALLARNPKQSRLFSSLAPLTKLRFLHRHITIGGDIAHFHPSFDGAALGGHDSHRLSLAWQS
jgi:hypothetical protein